jgi:hypothetical protein
MILAFAAVVEIATGLALIAAPGIIVELLLGLEVSDTGSLLGRFFGIALLALGTACAPSKHSETNTPVFWAMLMYNGLVALYLTYLGTAGHLTGLLLWPAMALHGIVALLLVWSRLHDRRDRSHSDQMGP